MSQSLLAHTCALPHIVLTLLFLCMCIMSSSVSSLQEFNPLPPCELIFPKQGDLLIHNGHTYNLIMCHFSPSTEKLLNRTLRQYTLVVHALILDHSTGQYVNAGEFPPFTARSPLMLEVTKPTTISEFYIPSSPFQLNTQYKLVYQVYVGDMMVDQVTTIVTYKDNAYFRSQLGLEKINLVDFSVLCDAEGEGENEACPLLESARDSLFTERFDFIEIGTSAFDTYLQKAEPHHRGISVEPLSFYQDMLPNPIGVIKENAAIDVKHSFTVSDTDSDSEVDFGLMYYLDPNDILAHGITMDADSQYFMYGISSFGSVQTGVLNLHRLDSIYISMSIFLQKSRLVPRLSIEELYTKHAVREVGVVKLDCEGLDIAIVVSYLDMLQKYHLPHPCVLTYEVLTSTKEVYSIVETLQSLGYAIFSLAFEGESVGDFFALHSDCPISSIRWREVSVFLPSNFENVHDMCNRNGKSRYCCVTKKAKHDNKDHSSDYLCDELQTFYL